MMIFKSRHSLPMECKNHHRSHSHYNFDRKDSRQDLGVWWVTVPRERERKSLGSSCHRCVLTNYQVPTASTSNNGSHEQPQTSPHNRHHRTDGSYLAELLLEKGYAVHGIKRRASSFNTTRIDHLYQDPHELGEHGQPPRLTLHYGDLSDGSNLQRIIEQVQPDEIYNLGAQSHVAVSFEAPEYTANVDALGTLRILEAVRICGLVEKTRIYQASTSELYGLVQENPQRETTPFHPRSPYGVAKLYAYWITVNYREAYGMYACNGLLFNHESPRRGETFVTRKITRGLARIDAGLEDCLFMGNLDALRDWGHARDYVEMQWRMLQQETPEDFVIATGRQESVRRFIELSASALNWGEIRWEGNGLQELGRRSDTGAIVVRIDPRYFRPAEVETLLGDPTKAREKLGWTPSTTLEQLVNEMIAVDKEEARKEAYLKRKGFQVIGPRE